MYGKSEMSPTSGMEQPMRKLTTKNFSAARMNRRTTINRTHSLAALLVVDVTLVLSGCGPAMTRPEVDRQKLLTTRSAADQQATTAGQQMVVKLLQRTKA